MNARTAGSATSASSRATLISRQVASTSASESLPFPRRFLNVAASRSWSVLNNESPHMCLHSCCRIVMLPQPTRDVGRSRIVSTTGPPSSWLSATSVDAGRAEDMCQPHRGPPWRGWAPGHPSCAPRLDLLLARGLAAVHHQSGGHRRPVLPHRREPRLRRAGVCVNTTYDPNTSSFDSTTVVTAKATARQARFDLDLSSGLTVTSVRVDGLAAHFGPAGAA